MNIQNLAQYLAELSGMAHSIQAITESENVHSIAHHLECSIDDLIQSLPQQCEHKWYIPMLPSHELQYKYCGECGVKQEYR